MGLPSNKTSFSELPENVIHYNTSSYRHWYLKDYKLRPLTLVYFVKFLLFIWHLTLNLFQKHFFCQNVFQYCCSCSGFYLHFYSLFFVISGLLARPDDDHWGDDGSALQLGRQETKGRKEGRKHRRRSKSLINFFHN